MSSQDAGARRRARLAAQVDWSKVIDPYTAERYGPEVLEELWGADRSRADSLCTSLYFAANGDGSSVRAAAAEMLPFLVEAAGDPEVTVRCEILRTIAAVAATGNTAPTAKVGPILEGRWRPAVDPAWPAAWERAAEALLPLLDDDHVTLRASAATALAQSSAHADALITRFRDRFEKEPDAWAAGQLVRGVGELARHATRRREEALGWLRRRMTDEGKGAEPDIDEDVEAWLDWQDTIRHDVRLEAVEALCRALPGHTDPVYARVTTDALLTSAFARPPAEYVVRDVDVITEADRRLGADLPGRLALAHALLRVPDTAHREGGLKVAAGLMSRWRSAVPELLPAVAGLVTDPCPENRVLALRLLAMCGDAARPWAGLVATRLDPAVEPYEPAREHAVQALSRTGDERCVPHLAELLTRHGGFITGHAGSPGPGRDGSGLSFTEALAPFAAHTDVLLDPLLARIERTASSRHPYFSVLRRWHQDGGDVVPRLIQLLETDGWLTVAAHALYRTGAGAVAAAHRERLRERLGKPITGRGDDLARIGPFEYHALTGDDEPLRALLHPPGNSGFPGQDPRLAEPTLLLACVTLGPSAAPAAERLRGMLQEALRGERQHRPDAPRGAVGRARALWRVTGDAGEVLPALLELTARSTLAVHRTPGSVEALVLLAEVAATHPPVRERVARQLRATAGERIRHRNPLDAVRIVRSLWQLTSDPHRVVPALTELVGICPPPGSTGPTVLEPLRLLAEAAAVDPASVSPAMPALRALLDADERPAHHDDHWGAVPGDDALRAAVREVLNAAAAQGATATADAGDDPEPAPGDARSPHGSGANRFPAPPTG
ncbi:hypothetical protein [Streptomyces sp. NPDC054863]